MEDLFTNKALNVPFMYEDGIKRGQNDTFIIFERVDGSFENITYNTINDEANALLEKMKSIGLKKGDRVGVISSLRPMWYALSYACLKGGFIMVCMDPGIPYTQIQKMMIQTDVRTVFTTIKNIKLPDELNEHIPVYLIDNGFPLLSKCEKIDILLDEPLPMPEDTFYVLFSSGTTGENRKAVLLRHSTISTAIEYGMSKDAGIYKNHSPFTVRECDLMMFPPYHIAGLLCLTYDIYCNTKIVMLERLTPNSITKVFEEIKPDNICTVPSLLTSLYKKIVSSYSSKPLLKLLVNTLLSISGFLRKNLGINAGHALLKPINNKAFGGNMRGFMIGASPFDETANKFFLNMGINVSMSYGLTELGAPLAVTGDGYYPGTTGRALRHTKDLDIRITNKDETGKGEVEVLSPYRMISYLNKEDNEGCFTEDGYFKTGDLGYFDKKKCLVICGRIKDTIVLRNGEKLLPEEIESKYQNISCVDEVAAFKIPDEGGCDAFGIAVLKNKQSGIPDEAIKERIFERADHLPSMYRPKDVYVIKEFPLSSSHKVQRFRLTQMVIEGNTNPITDSLMVPVGEDETAFALKQMLVKVGGPQWKNEELTSGLLLNLDSLATVDLYVEIQEKWGIDLFQLSSTPETFGELIDLVKNFDVSTKNDKVDIDYSKYPLPVSKLYRTSFDAIEKLAKRLWRVNSEGIENLPKETNYLLCPNHQSELDPGFICSCLDKETSINTCIVGKSDLINNKLLKKFVVSHNYIPVDRTGNSIKTLDRCKELLLEGRNVLIFPEGTSSQNHQKLFPLKEGAARLSVATNKPIVPVHISGIAHQDKETGSFRLPSLKSKVTITFGKPIYPENKNPQEVNELLKEKMEEMYK